jgi:hypothetical protein
MEGAVMFDHQRTFREVNDRIAEVAREEGAASFGFLCECGELGCIATVTLRVEDYPHMAAAGLILAHGHEPAQLDAA